MLALRPTSLALASLIASCLVACTLDPRHQSVVDRRDSPFTLNMVTPRQEFAMFVEALHPTRKVYDTIATFSADRGTSIGEDATGITYYNRLASFRIPDAYWVELIGQNRYRADIRFFVMTADGKNKTVTFKLGPGTDSCLLNQFTNVSGLSVSDICGRRNSFTNEPLNAIQVFARN